MQRTELTLAVCLLLFENRRLHQQAQNDALLLLLPRLRLPLLRLSQRLVFRSGGLSAWVRADVNACGRVGIASGLRRRTSDIDLLVHDSQYGQRRAAVAGFSSTSQLRAI